MISINLHQPGYLNCDIPFPSEWNELFPEEVMEVCRQQIKNNVTQDEQRAALLKFIITFRTKVSKKKLPPSWMNLVNAEEFVAKGFPLLDFIYKENALIKPAENKIKLPGIFSPTVYGPGESFQKITCGEFEDAEVCFQQFYNEPDGKPLARLAAILWRNKNDTIYITYRYKSARFVTYNAEKNTKRFLKIAPERLYAIFMWYAGCRNQLPKLFPTVHEGGGDKNDELDLMAFTKCIHAGAGKKNGLRPDIRRTKLFEFFFEMEEEAKKANELKRMYEQQK